MVTLIIKNQLISCYTHLALLTQDQQTWHPLPKNWSSKSGRIWNGKSNIHLFPYPFIWRWETLLSCWRNSHGLSSGGERNSCLPRGEKQGCSQEYGTADQHPLQMSPPLPPPMRTRLSSSCRVHLKRLHHHPTQPTLRRICNFSAPGAMSPMCPPWVIVKLLWLVILI